MKLTSNGIGSIHGKLYLGTAEKIPPVELIDTTGAGDAFIGAVLYGLCAEMPPEKMLPFAARVNDLLFARDRYPHSHGSEVHPNHVMVGLTTMEVDGMPAKTGSLAFTFTMKSVR
ncbi:hypothetical protein Taro_013781 [Colocasia esculenta]|uniref:Carbohydrate kinase PfkB domain-containing protein n=1 Tax=Colocasia esculenta TaxID=4460 RepID=A0A843UN80_COLES|nr:hypothetical protein [Colocasia esculenta]